MCTQLSLCEQETPAEGKGEQPLFSSNKKKKKKKQTRDSYKGTKPLRMD